MRLFSKSMLVVGLVAASAASVSAAEPLTLYSGRGEALVDPIVRQFERDTGIQVNVRYAGTSELAVLLQEEGDRSPADVYWAQDAGALGALAGRGLLRELTPAVYEGLPSIYTTVTGRWVATSGRARTLVYSTDRIDASALPASVFDLARDDFRGRVAWAPTNGSFQAFITAMRVVHGEQTTREWLESMVANDVQAYRNNTSIVQAVADGEVDLGIVNNYYLLRFKASDSEFPVAQTFFDDGDIGNLVNVAGAAVVAASDQPEAAERFVAFLLSPAAQQYFTGNVYEYPVIPSVIQSPELVEFDRLLALSPQVDLDRLEDLDGTLALLRDVGLL